MDPGTRFSHNLNPQHKLVGLISLSFGIHLSMNKACLWQELCQPGQNVSEICPLATQEHRFSNVVLNAMAGNIRTSVGHQGCPPTPMEMQEESRGLLQRAICAKFKRVGSD